MKLIRHALATTILFTVSVFAAEQRVNSPDGIIPTLRQ